VGVLELLLPDEDDGVPSPLEEDELPSEDELPGGGESSELLLRL
jgi:hypothetical protein